MLCSSSWSRRTSFTSRWPSWPTLRSPATLGIGSPWWPNAFHRWTSSSSGGQVEPVGPWWGDDTRNQGRCQACLRQTMRRHLGVVLWPRQSGLCLRTFQTWTSCPRSPSPPSLLRARVVSPGRSRHGYPFFPWRLSGDDVHLLLFLRLFS